MLKLPECAKNLSICTSGIGRLFSRSCSTGIVETTVANGDLEVSSGPRVATSSTNMCLIYARGESLSPALVGSSRSPMRWAFPLVCGLKWLTSSPTRQTHRSGPKASPLTELHVAIRRGLHGSRRASPSFEAHTRSSSMRRRHASCSSYLVIPQRPASSLGEKPRVAVGLLPPIHQATTRSRPLAEGRASRLRSGLIRTREVHPSLRRLCPSEAGGIIGRR